MFLLALGEALGSNRGVEEDSTQLSASCSCS